MMKKYFNTTGPCHPDEHYMLPTQERCVGLLDLIERKQYFVIHAARQTGKTTLLLELAKQLNETGDYYALYCSLETVQGITDVEKGIPAIIRELDSEITLNNLLPTYRFADTVNTSDFNTMLRLSLSYLCQKLDKPLIILFDRKGQQQLADYMDKLSCSEGWLMVFDRRKTIDWNQKIFWRTKSIAGKMIHSIGC